jgi:CspA family cold shock protein
MAARVSGTVKWFNDAKGFGFIEHSGGEDVFAHFRSIRGDGYRTLKQGATVEFTMLETEKGFQADDIAETELDG